MFLRILLAGIFVIPFAAWVMSIIWSFANRDVLKCGLTAETVAYIRRRKRWSKVFVISFVITSALWGGFFLVSLGGLVAFKDINWYEKSFYLLVVSYLVIVWNLAARGGAKLLFEDNDDLFFHYDSALYNLRGILESYKAKFGVPRNLQKGIKESERLNRYLKRIHKHYFRPKWIR